MSQRTITLFTIVIVVFAIMSVIGYFTWKNSTEIQSQNKNTRTSQSVPTSSETISNPVASWKTYRNQKLGFTLEYPSDLSVKNENNSTLFINARNQQFSVEILNVKSEDEALSLSGFVKTGNSIFYGSEAGNSSATLSMINSDQVFMANTLVRIYGIDGGNQGNGEGFTILIENDGKFATIDAAALSKDVFTHILSTFQFIR